MGTEDLYQAALDAIKELFGDTSASQEETARNLEALQGEIDILLDCLP